MGCFLLIRHWTLSIFLSFNILAGLRIKSCVSPYRSLYDETFLVFFNTHKHRTHIIIVHTMIKVPRSWQDSMISLLVFFSVLLPLVDYILRYVLIDHRYPNLTHGKRYGSIKAYYRRGEPRITTRIQYKYLVPAETIRGSGSVGSLLCLWNVKNRKITNYFSTFLWFFIGKETSEGWGTDVVAPPGKIFLSSFEFVSMGKRLKRERQVAHQHVRGIRAK